MQRASDCRREATLALSACVHESGFASWHRKARTQVYTQVAIVALKEIHTATHPARVERREEAERIEQARPNRLLKRVYERKDV